MQRKVKVWMAFVSLVMLMMVGCGATFNQLVYREQATSLETYKIINSTFEDLRGQGLITDDGWKKYSEYANKFLDEHKKVSEAMVKYAGNQTTQGQIQLAQDAMIKALEILEMYYFKTIPKDKQKPLF